LRRALLPAAVAGAFLAILAAVVILFVRWAGSPQALVPLLRHPPALAMGLLSLGYVALSAWIVVGAHRAIVVGWLAAVPGLIALAALAAEASRSAIATAVLHALDPVLGPLVSAALMLPFSAGPLVFSIGFPLAMIARGALRRLRRYRAQA
jgi:hypothetical protein